MKNFLKGLWNFLQGVYYSLPLQLLVFQFKHHKSILLLWVIIFATINKHFGMALGIPYLFLAPEYLGEVNFKSLFLVGSGAGAFIAFYNIATYISDSYRIHFLALLRKPFYTYFLNNSTIPLIFMVWYSWAYLDFQILMRGGFSWQMVWELCGFLFGLSAFLLAILGYFLGTNSNLQRFFGKNVWQELKRGKVILGKARLGLSLRYRIDYFIGANLKVRKVDPTVRADFRNLVQVLNQNHGNALFLQLILLVALLVLAIFEEQPLFQFPAATSALLFFSLVLMLSSAATFWFRKIGVMTFVVVAGSLFLANHFQLLSGNHPAFGMDYETDPVPYSLESLDRLQGPDENEVDYANTLMILEGWKRDYQLTHGPDKKPKVVFISTSGGGLRAAYLTLRCMQVMDSVSNHKLMPQTRLITGASGGMVGAGYFRELYWRKERGEKINLHSPQYPDRISHDLLNPVCLKIVTGFLLPTQKIQVGDQRYRRDRGWVFDRQLMENLPEFKNRRLADYRTPEAHGILPMMILTPVIIDDGRRMYVSSTPVSYMTKNIRIGGGYDLGYNGVEFSRFFAAQDADSVLFSTALRMNASFPVITPYVGLPSEPRFRVIDAGAGDNFGVQTFVRFLYNFRDWFAENTEEVLVVQIRDSERKERRQVKFEEKGILGKMMEPIGGSVGTLSKNRDVSNDDYLDFTEGWYDGKISYVSLEYARDPLDSTSVPASLSWRLTDREIESIEAALLQEQNQLGFAEVRAFFEGE